MNTQEEWDEWFQDIELSVRNKKFLEWEKLVDLVGSVENILQSPDFNFSQPIAHIRRAQRLLDFKRPYHIVVIGESGAGKSTLINSMMNGDFLTTGVGGAVTGVATYLYPNSAQPYGEYVNIIYRTEDEIKSLIERIKSMETNPQLKDKIDATIRDIQHSFTNLKRESLVGQSQKLDLLNDRETLVALMEENSKRNTVETPGRVIAGIKQVEFHLADFDKLKNCVIVDTPGLGARTLRHEEILRSEVEIADAVLLVVNARRPEQQSDEVASIMQSLLFSGYSNEQKSTFASKVFLVVNQIDVIESEQDRHRLDISVGAIAEVISADYLQNYGADNGAKRYFEIDSRDESLVSTFRDAVENFLVHNRLDLLLQESSVLSNNAIESSKGICKLGLENLEEDMADMLPDELDEYLTIQFCSARLEADQEQLQTLITGFYDKLSSHVESTEHAEKLQEIIKKLRATQTETISSALPSLIKSLDQKTYDSTNLRRVVDVAEQSLLLMLEDEIRKNLEKEMEQSFAPYYIDLFRKNVNEVKLYEMLQVKSYNQKAILEGLKPIESLQNIETEIANNYYSACKQILIFELTKMPIIESLRRDSKVWEIIKESSLFTQSSPANRQSPKPAEGSNNMFDWRGRTKKILQDMGVPSDSNAIDDLQEEKERDKEFLNELKDSLPSVTSSNQNLSVLEELLVKKFEFRTDTALKEFLPHLESIFFYSLGNFITNYSNLIAKMIDRHKFEIGKPDSNIRKIVKGQSSETINRQIKAATILKQLNEVSSVSSR